MADRDDHSDPLWDMRRKIMLWCLAFCAIFLLFCALLISAEKITAMAPLFAAVAAFAAPVVLGYFGIAEWGSIKRGTITTEVTEQGPPSVKTSVTTPVPDQKG